MTPIASKRIDNLEFAVSSYLLPKTALPEHVGFSINKYYQNPYYGKENEYKKEGEFYTRLEEGPYGCRTCIHENCFKNPESPYVIASWDWDDEDGYYNFEFVDNRPLQLNEDERKIFWELLEYGFDILRDNDNDNENERKIRQFWKHPFKYDGYGNIMDARGTMLVFSFYNDVHLTDDFIENMVKLLNGDKDAIEMKSFVLDGDGHLYVYEPDREYSAHEPNGTFVGKFRGHENVEEYYKHSEEACESWDVWQAFLGFCDNRLKKNY